MVNESVDVHVVTTRMAEAISEGYPWHASDDSGVEQQRQSWEAFTAQGKAWPQYDVKSTMNRSLIIPRWRFISTDLRNRGKRGWKQ